MLNTVSETSHVSVFTVDFHIKQILNDTFVKLLVSCVNCEVF